MARFRRVSVRRRRRAVRRGRGKAVRSIARSEARRVFNRNTELKYFRSYFDVDDGLISANSMTSFSYGTSTAIYSIEAPVVVGPGVNQRVGRVIRAKGLHMDFMLQGASDTEVNNVRIMVVSPKESAPAAPSSGFVANFLASLFNVAAPNVGQYSYAVNKLQWNVLYDKRKVLYPFNIGGNVAGDNVPIRIRKFLRLNRKMTFPEVTSVPTAGQSNKPLYLVLMSDSLAIPHPGIVGGFHTFYFQDG